MKRLLTITWLFLLPALLKAQHPVAFFTRTEAAEVKKGLSKYPVLQQSYAGIKKQVDAWLGKDVDVPVPKDPAGGYTHDRHKANYMLMFNSGVLYNITGDQRYALLVKNMLLKYAALNPSLKKHPEATSSSPGHIFWQALNDANWLVYTGMAYDFVYNFLSSTDRNTIEQGAFKPEVDFITKDLNSWFNLIHNHGVWACAGVGIVGIATNNKEYVDEALYGSAKDGKTGFIAQLDNLFSPDGYYTEGPYYVRYAVLPFYLFANALQHARPELKIFQHRNRILQKALLTGLQQTNIDGTFFPLNDAILEKDYTSNELVTSVDIAWNVYGSDPGLLVVANHQGEVLLNKGGASIAGAIAASKNISSYYPYHSVEYVDGARGDEGGISILRNGRDKDLSSLIFKYTSHGLSHGHFDKLNIELFDQGNEILTDYGSVRFVGIEQKYGGRYLPENTRYAAQTIAHNTVVADETSHFDGNEKMGEKFHSDKLFSDISSPSIQVVAAKEGNAYKNIHLQRTVYSIVLPGGKKIIADLFDVISPSSHQYDLPFHYNGQLIHTSFPYQAFTNQQETIGKKNGYQFLWKEAEATVRDTLAQLTFLTGKTYYTVSSLVQGDASLVLGRTGASDPNFNLRHEPVFIIRKKATNTLFASIIEMHGGYDPITEISSNAYPSVQNIHLVQHDDDYTITEIMIAGKKLVIAQCNRDFSKATEHSVKGIKWTGPYAVMYDSEVLGKR